VDPRDSSKLDPLISTLFFCPFHGRNHAQRDRPATSLCGYARGGAPFRCGETSESACRDVISRSAPQRATRSFFPQKKRRSPSAQPTQAAVRTALPSGFAKQTEKGERSQRGKLAHIRDLPHLFQSDCRAIYAAK